MCLYSYLRGDERGSTPEVLASGQSNGLMLATLIVSSRHATHHTLQASTSGNAQTACHVRMLIFDTLAGESESGAVCNVYISGFC